MGEATWESDVSKRDRNCLNKELDENKMQSFDRSSVMKISEVE